jgi:G3E family GTPase
MALRIDRIPVILLTGFLGSGKTTLLRRLLAGPGAGATAVLINELGAIGLDHQLAWGAADTTVVLENGCVCCSVQQELSSALEDLFWRRLHRKIPRFERVVIETTGIADPARIVGLFSGMTLTAERYVLDSVVCTVDGLLGEQQLQQHAECLSQAALADVLVITKADLVDNAHVSALELALRQLNPGAALRRSSAGSAAADVLSLVGGLEGPQLSRGQRVGRAEGTPGPLLGPLTVAAAHARVTSFVLRFAPFAAPAALQSMLDAALSLHGARLLRIKGLVEVGEDTRPMVVQAVGARLFPFDRIPAQAQWAGPGFLVFITRDLALEDLLRCEPLARARLAEIPHDQRQS